MNNTEKIKIGLISLEELDSNQSLQILRIRNDASVRRRMYTDHEISLPEHQKWLNRVNQDESRRDFAVLHKGLPIGVVSAVDINSKHGTASWAYYLQDSARGGIGAFIEYCFIEYIFNELKVDKLNCEVIEGNAAVVKLHEKFLFSKEGFRRSNVVKDGVRCGVYLLGLTGEDWLSGKASLFEKYRKFFDKFTVEIIRKEFK
jgi:UDP-4-amino-4,6-dideoxy-N-acetyl-beta-L-altrosamine N-acetyltransferase